MAQSLPFPTLLSQALVAFTIELDNEFERQMPHRTTNHGLSSGSVPGPWLVSVVMYSNCMQFVGESGIKLCDLEYLTRTGTNLNGMERWRYIDVEKPKPRRADWMMRATRKGLLAREIWRPLFSDIETRWQARFGKDVVDQLRESLRTVASGITSELPACLPILGYGLFSKGLDSAQREPDRTDDDVATLNLLGLLSRVLLAFAIEFERESDISLAISANLLRVLDEKGVRVRELPLLTGVSKESLSMAMGILQKKSLVVIEAGPATSRVKVGGLTSKGQEAQDSYRDLLAVVEERWRARFGEDTIDKICELLQPLVGEPSSAMSPLLEGLEPYPDGWRASVPKPETLPHYPMVLHRGGFPDGS